MSDVKHKIKIDIASNYDKKMIDILSEYDEFKWVYGKLNNDVVGGGRPSIRLPNISWEDLKDYVEYCHQHNIKFNYLLNALCLSGKEFQKSYHLEIIDLLKNIDMINADGVTIASPYLCQIVKKQFPHLFISVSIYNKVQSLPPLKYWKDIGADEITLFHTMNRNFKMLERILAYAKSIGLKIRLVANNSCLHECPFHANHAVTHCHGSKADETTRLFHFDYQILNCNLIKIKDPSKIISSEWIRPEDVHYYEELCDKVDYDGFSIKLTERGRTTEWLARTAKAYHERSYDGNLLDIINFVGKGKFYTNMNDEHFSEIIREKGYNSDLVKNYRRSILYNLPYIDNKKLDNFIKFFKDSYICDVKNCAPLHEKDSNEGGDFNCYYCAKWAEKAVSIDETERAEIIERAEKSLDAVNSSDFFINEK